MAERSLIVSETDFRGNRIVAIAGTGWRTMAAPANGIGGSKALGRNAPTRAQRSVLDDLKGRREA